CRACAASRRASTWTGARGRDRLASAEYVTDAGCPHGCRVDAMSERAVVRYEVADRVARITLDRPERGNGITPQLLSELVACVEQPRRPPAGSPLDPAVIAANHDPRGVWDPTVDYAMMSRNVRAFMSLF